MKYSILLGLIFIFFFTTCKKGPIEYPILSAPLLSPQDLTDNQVDQNRICVGEIISELCKKSTFLDHIKSATLTEENSFNLEYNLLTNLSSEVDNGVNLQTLIEETIEEHGNGCVSSIEDFKQVLENDPLLVLKVPDIIDISTWNTSTEIPFIYVKTGSPIRNPINSAQYGFIGIHHSGAIDFYNNGFTRFFPLVLKNSEELLALDQYSNTHNGIQLDQLHSSFNRLLNREDLQQGGTTIEGSDLTLININTLLENSNRLNNLYSTPTEINECDSQCFYSCLPHNERQLLCNEIFIHNANNNVLEYEFKSAFRPGARVILNDNITPLLLLNQTNGNNIKSQKNILLGSFRLNQLFSTLRSRETVITRYTINNNTVDIAEIEISVDVTGKKVLDITHNSNLMLLDDISEDDLLIFSASRLSLDQPTQNLPVTEDVSLFVGDVWRDNVLNYDLYCLSESRMLGFNSLAIKYKF